MHRGYIKLWRCSIENRLYFAEPFTKWQAWQDLLIITNHKNTDARVIRGIPIEFKRGQVLAGEEYLANRWKWSRGKVRRFLHFLESETVQQITRQTVQQTNKVIGIVTILNWEIYQSDSTANSTPNSPTLDTSNGTTDGHQTVQQTDTPKNVKNVKNVKNTYSVLFEKFWLAYPRKDNKTTAYKAFVKIEPTDKLVGIFLKAIVAQKQSSQWLKDNGDFIPYASTWLSQHRWEDEIKIMGISRKKHLAPLMILRKGME